MHDHDADTSQQNLNMQKHTQTLIKELSRSDGQSYALTDANSSVNVKSN